jgi:hypothetical protein
MGNGRQRNANGPEGENGRQNFFKLPTTMKTSPAGLG